MKSITGMSYYSLDYLSMLTNEDKIIFTSNKIVKDFYFKNFPNTKIVNSRFTIKPIFYILKFIFLKRKFFIYTPTSHPIPFLNNQLVILHDTYPFKSNLLGKIKDILFKSGILFSNSYVGFVNNTFSGKYLKSFCSRNIFLPNLYPYLKIIDNIKMPKKVFKIALAGTSCIKKDHQIILKNAISKNHKLKFYLYGDKTKYANYILDNFSDLNLIFVDSSIESLEEFIKRVDILLVQNKFEGFCRPVMTALLENKLIIAPKAKIYKEFFRDAITYYDKFESLIVIFRNLLTDKAYYKSYLQINNKNRNQIIQLINNNTIKSRSLYLDTINKNLKFKNDL